jgi:hypothetical protein
MRQKSNSLPEKRLSELRATAAHIINKEFPMQRSILLTFAVMALLAVLLAGGNSQGADPSVANAVKVLLDKGWEKTAAGKELANHAKLNEPPLSEDSTVLAARWLVLMHQNSYSDALTNLDKFLNAKPTDDLRLSALRAKAWLFTAQGNYPRAILAAGSLAQAVSPNSQSAESTIASFQADAIEFLGHLAGFLEGPVERAADQNARKRFEADVLARFDEPRKKIFKDAKAEVLAEFQHLLGGATEAEQNSKQSAEAEKQKALERLSTVSEQLSKDEGKLDDKKKQLEADVQSKLASLQRYAAPLIGTLTALQNQSNTMTLQLNQQHANIQRLQQQVASEQNSQVRQQLQTDLHLMQNAACDTQRLVNDLSGRIAMMRQKLVGLDQQIRVLGGGAMMKGQQLEQQQVDLDRQKQSLVKKQMREERLKSSAGAKAATLGNEARAFSTYDEFPLDELRDRVLKAVQ